MLVESLSKKVWDRYPKTTAILAYSLWVAFCFIAAVWLVVSANVTVAHYFGWILESAVGSNIATIIVNGAVFAMMLVLLLGVPAALRAGAASLRTLGMQRLLPAWRDIGLALAGVVLYFVGAFVVMLFAAALPWVDIEQAQDIGISAPQGIELWLAFVLLVIVTPIVEEVIFRGYFYGKLRDRKVPIWLAVLVVSVLFGVAHSQWNVGLNVFVLSVVMCLGREITGSIWPGILMHMFKNGLAVYLLYVSPSMLGM